MTARNRQPRALAPMLRRPAHRLLFPLVIGLLGVTLSGCEDFDEPQVERKCGTKTVVVTAPSGPFNQIVTIFSGNTVLNRRVIMGVPGLIQSILDEECKKITGQSLLQVTNAADTVQIAAAQFPVDATADDFDGDGNADVAVANQDSNNVSIFLGNSDGTFANPIEYPTGTSPQHIKAGDFNNDGKVDLVTANRGDDFTGDVSLLFGNGDASFQAPLALIVGIVPLGGGVAVGDFDEDGNLDLALPIVLPWRSFGGGGFNEDGSSYLAPGGFSFPPVVAVRLGNGDGTFRAPSTPSVSRQGQSIVADDLNVDGHLDLVTGGSVLLGTGNGTFQASIDFDSSLGAEYLVVRTGNLNGDNRPDVVVTSGGSHIVSILLNNGNGTLQTAYHARHYVTGNNPSELSIVDLDGDDILDLLVSNFSDDHLSLFYGNGDGTFAGLPTYPAVADFAQWEGASDAAVADFTGDTVPDIVAVSNNLGSALLPGLGAGAFGAAITLPGLDGSRMVAGDWNSWSWLPWARSWSRDGARVVAGDWNGDAKPDLAITSDVRTSTGGGLGLTLTLAIALGNGNGTFGPPTNFPLSDGDFFTDFLATALVNADSVPDLLVADTGAGNVSVFLGDGNGGFTAQPTVPIGTLPNGLATGDLDGDGKLDLAVANKGDFVELDGSLQIALGNGDGTFQTPRAVRTSVRADSVVIADFNLDGRADLAVVMEAPQSDWDIEILLGNGNGTFNAPQPLGLTNDLVHSLRVADGDQDGIPDLAVSLEGTKAAGLRGLGDGSFEPPVFADVGGGTIVPADLNLDGLLDYVSPSGRGLVAAIVTVPGAFTDTDGDGVSDAADSGLVAAIVTVPGAFTDTDGDGVSDAADNCPAKANASQTDKNGDGVGDPCSCDVLTATITGSDGDDILTGTDGNDVIFGLDGNDTIDGGNGDDVICGNNDADTITGGDGNDLLFGNGGADTLKGKAGADEIRGGGGNDIVKGGGGDDTVKGGGGDDTLKGSGGTDTCNGGAGTDTISGGCEVVTGIP